MINEKSLTRLSQGKVSGFFVVCFYPAYVLGRILLGFANNRRAYEDKIDELEQTSIAEDFVYISVDVNGLKVVNDTLGHAAGDELIIGAYDCPNRSLGKFGTVYRTGGDEFVVLINATDDTYAIVNMDASEQTTEKGFTDTISGWLSGFGKSGQEHEMQENKKDKCDFFLCWSVPYRVVRYTTF